MNRTEGIRGMTSARIRFTAATVREVSERVRHITGGAFALDTTRQTRTDGTPCYTDAGFEHDWRGPEGARQACAWLIGGALGMAYDADAEIPVAEAAYLRHVLTAAGDGSQARKAGVAQWEKAGRDRAAGL